MAATDLEIAWREQLRAHWPDCGPLTQLAGEHDLNFADAQRVYKVMASAAQPDSIALQIAALQHLESGLPRTPAVVLTASGEVQGELRDGARSRIAWAIERLPGVALTSVRPWDSVVDEFGVAIGQLHNALADFEHPALDRDLRWRLDNALALAGASPHLDRHPHRDTIRKILADFTTSLLPQLAALPQQAIHHDLNDHNLMCRSNPGRLPEFVGVIDFGDMVRGAAVTDLGVAAAYLIASAPHPLRRLRALVSAYTRVRHMTAHELGLVWPVLLTRMAMSMVIAWDDAEAGNDDPYRQVSQQAIVAFLQTAVLKDPGEVHRHLCAAAGLDDPHADTLRWIARPTIPPAAVMSEDLSQAPVLDLSVTGEHATDNPVAPALDEIADHVAQLAEPDRPVLGRYGEPRLVYGAPFYLSGSHGASDRRTVHIAIDVFLPAGRDVRAPYDGEILSAEIRDDEFDYGGLIVLRHEPEPGIVFYTLYGHLAHDSVSVWQPGQPVRAGEVLARLGTPDQNGGWPPHLHFQVSTTRAPGGDWPGVVDIDDLDYWSRRFPDPSALLGLTDTRAVAPDSDKALLERRQQHAPGNLRLSYAERPLDVVRGWRALLFDRAGRSYLDAYNNVPHVGHSHPRVRAAIDRQLRLVNTNTRYLQPVHVSYCEALLARFPAPLNRVFLLSSGSEANELAVRLARSATGGYDMLAQRAGYHGHTVAAIDLSDYKANGPGGGGTPDWVHLIDNPDTFAGRHRDDDAAERYAADAKAVIERVRDHGSGLAGLIAETFPSVGGQVIPPDGYLDALYREVRAAGGVCIADEVQTGLGRLGDFLWGFEQQGVVPDIVVLGKPMGNGYPLAAVVTTDAIADAFDSGMEFFATFGGSSVACAAGLAVLQITERDGLASNAAATGAYLKAGLSELAQQHPLLADVRGLGLFLGVAIADEHREPRADITSYIVNRLRDRRVLIGSDGPDHNVLKIRPPLCFDRADADHLLSQMGAVMQETAVR